MSIRVDLPESLESRLVISRQMEKRLGKPTNQVGPNQSIPKAAIPEPESSQDEQP
jgi:hypothetical protein